MTVYSEDRARRLRLVLYVVCGVALLLGLFSIGLVLGGGDNRGPGIFALVVALALLAAALRAVWLVAHGSPRAKFASAATGVVCVLAGLGLVGTWLAFVLPLLGLGLAFLALTSDGPLPGTGQERQRRK